MDTGVLKKFAQGARRQLREQVAARLEHVLRTDSAELREKQNAVAELREQIKQSSKAAVIDRVAYTWFNRFCALRYMDVNHYTRVGVVSPLEGFTQPEILQEAKQGLIDADLSINRQRVLDLLSGKLPSSDPQQEAYRLLLVASCNAYYKIMPFMFEKIEDYTELLMPEDLLSENSVLHSMRLALNEANCQDVEVIGWLYQFYISERKDEVFENLKKNIKIEAEDIPAATQLFTPHWIVRYLVENSLGRLWMLNHPDSRLVERMDYYIKPAQEETDFLKIESPEEIKICDPACGSGHMLTYAFDLMYAIYEESGYDPVQIPRMILEKNLFGIEIDPRAGALAAFALFMKARTKDRRFFIRTYQPNICVLENVMFSDDELNSYMTVIGRDLFTQELWFALKRFENSQTFGSLIRPQLNNFGYLRVQFEEKKVFENLFLHATNHKVQLVLKQSEYLSPRYHVIVTNPPYMGSRGLNDRLKGFSQDQYPETKSDLYTMFIERNLVLVLERGMVGMITMQSWMFLSSFEGLRRIVLRNTILSMAHLGPNAFDTIGGEVVSTTAFIIGRSLDTSYKGRYIRLTEGENENAKTTTLKASVNAIDHESTFTASGDDFKIIPSSPIAYWVNNRIRNLFLNSPLESITISDGQNVTSDNTRFLRYHWEINSLSIGENKKWLPYAKGGGFRRWYGNIIDVIDWSKGAREYYRKHESSRIIPEYLWYKPGVTWGLITSSKPSFRLLPRGSTFDKGGSSVFFHNEDDINSTLGLLNSNLVLVLLNITNPTLNFQVENIRNIPFLFIKKQSLLENNVAKCLEISKNDWNHYEVSLDFKTNQILDEKTQYLSLASTYLSLRSEWEYETINLKNLEEENNQIIIEEYDLYNDIEKDVPSEDISLRCNPYYRYSGKKSKDEIETLLLADTMKEFVSYAVGCMFGRYSLDKPGLILANQGETTEDYRRQIPNPTFPPDEDNVIPILDEGWFADDITERFKQFLRVTFGEEHYEENLAFLEEAIGGGKDRRLDVRSYFLKDFYNYHIKMYKRRPIYWLFSSPGGSFNALIYMHRYRPDTVSVVLGYLREYIQKLHAYKAHQEQISIAIGASQSEKTRALKEVNRVNKVLAELKEYEDDVLYPLATQRIEIDLDDGVKVNYAKFGKALKKVPGL